jgi:beta-lactam-binding protein with PASTA domain
MKKLAMLLSVMALCVLVADAAPVNVNLGTAGNFGVLAGSGVTNAVAGTIINGDVGSYPTPAVSGLLAGDVNGILYLAAGAVVGQAQTDLVTAYNVVVGAADGNTQPVNLSGKTLDPNVYAIGAANFSAGNLTLDGHGDPNAQWIFHTTSITTAADFNVLLINSASASNVFWQVGTSATIAIRNNFAGNILAMTSITLNGTGTLNGRALARNGAVTISNIMTITVPNHTRSQATVPNVIDQNQVDANAAITGAGLVVGTDTNAYSDTVAAGLVISQNPVSGTAVAGGTDVNIIVSLGLPLIPNVVGQARVDANAAIIAASFTVGTVTVAHSDTVAAGSVISQNPAAGAARTSGTAVNTVISLGLPLIPNVAGQTRADANMAITAASFTVGTVTTHYSDTVAAGLVISQNPAGGAARTSGTDVNMVVSLGLPLIPNVVGQTRADANAAITAASFTIGTVTTHYSEAVAAGSVISQNPVAGTAVTSGTAVAMVVSLGPPLNKAVLVYKLTMAINPVIDYKDANGLKADVWKENLSAYVVFGVDNAYDVNDVNDATGPTVIVFGKDGTTKFQKTLGGNDPNSFVNIRVFGDVNSINPFEVTNDRDNTATSMEVGFGDSNATIGFDIGTSLYGVNSTTDIGQTEKLSVAKSLKGQVWISRQFVNGQGAATVSLDSKLTKDANKNHRTVAATVANIKTTVLHTYTPVNVLP